MIYTYFNSRCIKAPAIKVCVYHTHTLIAGALIHIFGYHYFMSVQFKITYAMCMYVFYFAPQMLCSNTNYCHLPGPCTS